MLDLPVRLIYIIGMPSGGTSCVTGILYENDWWSSHDRVGYEAKESYNALNGIVYGCGIFTKPHNKPSPNAVECAEDVFYKYKYDAARKGYNKCFMKAPGLPIWCEDIFVNSKVKVEPLLVWRDPASNALSMKKRFPFLTDGKNYMTPEEIAERGQNEILNLHKKHGWPLWKFGKDADLSVLEELLGIPLPIPYFDKDKIVNGG